jgi:vacuolar-type H+-ATPase subunit E/Vma4
VAVADVPLREYIEALLNDRDKAVTAAFDAQKEAVAAALAAAEKATEKAEVNAEKWRENANEWRGQSADRERTQQAEIAKLGATFLPRETFAEVVSAWSSWREQTDKRLNEGAGERRGGRNFRADAIAVIALLTSIVAVVVLVVHG